MDGELLPANKLVIAMGAWSGQARAWLNNNTPHFSGQKAHSIVVKTPSPVTAHCLFLNHRQKSAPCSAGCVWDCCTPLRSCRTLVAVPEGTSGPAFRSAGSRPLLQLAASFSFSGTGSLAAIPVQPCSCRLCLCAEHHAEVSQPAAASHAACDWATGCRRQAFGPRDLPTPRRLSLHMWRGAERGCRGGPSHHREHRRSSCKPHGARQPVEVCLACAPIAIAWQPSSPQCLNCSWLRPSCRLPSCPLCGFRRPARVMLARQAGQLVSIRERGMKLTLTLHAGGWRGCLFADTSWHARQAPGMLTSASVQERHVPHDHAACRRPARLSRR